MLKKFTLVPFLCLALGLVGGMAKAQVATFSFGPVTERSKDSVSVRLVNPVDRAWQIDSVITYPLYYRAGVGEGPSGPLGRPFAPGRWVGLQVAPAGDFTLTLGLHARHNVPHYAPLVVCAGALPGCLALQAQAPQVRYSKAYYNGTQGLIGQPLFTEIKRLANATTATLSYNTARDIMFMTVDNKRVNGQGATTNTLECVYTGRLVTNYASRQEAQGRDFNTEHTFPQGFFGSATPMVSDLHHLFPTDNLANNKRSNYPFDTVSTAITYDSAGSLLGNSPSGRIAFEPRAAQKGKTARAMCYFVTRYQDYTNFFTSQEPVLRRWAVAYPPDTADLRRNTAVQTAQGNRNPFTDYPQLLERIRSLVNPALAEPVIANVVLMPPRLELPAGGADTGSLFIAVVNAGNVAAQISLSAAPIGLQFVQVQSGQLLSGTAAQLRLRYDKTQLPSGPSQVQVNFTAGGQGGQSTVLVEVGGLRAARPAQPLLRLSVRPNPVSMGMGLEIFGHTGPWQVLDMTGRRVADGTAPTFTIQGMPPGLYLLRCGQQATRFVVQ